MFIYLNNSLNSITYSPLNYQALFLYLLHDSEFQGYQWDCHLSRTAQYPEKTIVPTLYSFGPNQS